MRVNEDQDGLAAGRAPVHGHRLPTSVYAGYGVGQVGGQIMRDTPALLLPLFITTALGISPFLASVVVLLPKIWVVFADPIAGLISDRWRSPWGRRRPFVLAGGIVGALTFYLLFNVPDISSQVWLAVYLTAMFAAMSTAYSAFSVPYLSMASEMSADPHERTTILSWRTGALAIGVLCGGALAPRLIGMSWAGHEGFALMGLVLGLIILSSTLALFFGTARAAFNSDGQGSGPMCTQLRIAWQNKPFVILIAANIVQYLAAGMSYAANAFFQSYIVQKPVAEILPPIIVIMVVVSIASMPLWVYAAGRFGKLPVYVWSLVLFAATLFVWLLAGPATLWPVWVGSACIGLFNTGFILMSYSVLTDTIAFDRAQSGLSREGILSAVYSATEKASFAIGGVGLTLLLGVSGFIPTVFGQTVEQPESALMGIRLGFIVVPAAMMLGSLLILRRFRLPESLVPAAT